MWLTKCNSNSTRNALTLAFPMIWEWYPRWLRYCGIIVSPSGKPYGSLPSITPRCIPRQSTIIVIVMEMSLLNKPNKARTKNILTRQHQENVLKVRTSIPPHTHTGTISATTIDIAEHSNGQMNKLLIYGSSTWFIWQKYYNQCIWLLPENSCRYTRHTQAWTCIRGNHVTWHMATMLWGSKSHFSLPSAILWDIILEIKTTEMQQ